MFAKTELYIARKASKYVTYVGVRKTNPANKFETKIFFSYHINVADDMPKFNYKRI